MKIDEKFLQEVGLSAMDEEQKREFLKYVQEEAEVRIGERIAEKLSDEQLDEFDMILDQNEAASWLKEKCPDYYEIVSRTIEEIKAEIRNNRDKLI